jgi:hypothetical protein
MCYYQYSEEIKKIYLPNKGFSRGNEISSSCGSVLKNKFARTYGDTRKRLSYDIFCVENNFKDEVLHKALIIKNK